MAGKPEIRVEGLAELRRDFRRVEDMESLAELRVGLKAAAEVVAQEAKGRASGFSQRAADTIRATSGGNRAYVVGGRAKLPWYGWADFGSRTPVSGNSREVGPWAGSGKGPAKGRFIYPAIDAKERLVVEAVEQAVSAALRKRDL
jgi:hypothetical protein